MAFSENRFVTLFRPRMTRMPSETRQMIRYYWTRIMRIYTDALREWLWWLDYLIISKKNRKNMSAYRLAFRMGFSSEAGFFFPKALPAEGWPVLLGSEGAEACLQPHEWRQHSMSASARCFREGFFYGFLLKVDVIWSSLKHRDVLTASLFGSGSQRGRRKNCAKSREKRILKKGKKFMKKEKNFFPSSYGNMCSPKKAFSSCKTANGKHAPSKRWVSHPKTMS